MPEWGTDWLVANGQEHQTTTCHALSKEIFVCPDIFSILPQRAVHRLGFYQTTHSEFFIILEIMKILREIQIPTTLALRFLLYERK